VVGAPRQGAAGNFGILQTNAAAAKLFVIDTRSARFRHWQIS